jgi:hypothetical protein
VAAHAQARGAPEVLLRLDDVGMNHSVNTAIERVAKTGLPFSVSVMFACPWYQEAAEMLKKYPHVTVGVHLVLNSEWRNYRWGPVLGKTGVPSLVDSVGYFLPSVREFLASKYDLGEVERELDAQMQRAIGRGSRSPTSTTTWGRRCPRRSSARSWSGSPRSTTWDLPILRRGEQHPVRHADRREEDGAHHTPRPVRRQRTNLWVLHVAERTPEMDVLFDRNDASQNTAAGVPLVAQHRQAELDAVLSPELAGLVKSNKVKLVTYEQVIARGRRTGHAAECPEPPHDHGSANAKRSNRRDRGGRLGDTRTHRARRRARAGRAGDCGRGVLVHEDIGVERGACPAAASPTR